MLAAAVAGFALVFALRQVGGEPGDGVTFLYVIPIILVALEYGPMAGVAAGLAAVALFAIWDATTTTTSPSSPTSRARSRSSSWAG